MNELDFLHDDDEPAIIDPNNPTEPVEPDPEIDPDEDQSPDPNNVDDTTNLPADPEGNEDPAKDPDPDVEGADLTGVERFLSKYGIEGGMIEFEDGSSEHFDKLEAEKQDEILSNLYSRQSKNIEEEYGLDKNEISLINYLRDNNTSMEAMVDSLANDRVQTLLAAQEAGSMDYKQMSDDAIYTKFLKESNPEIATDKLEADLQAAKSLSSYTNMVNSLRNRYTSDQEARVAKYEQESIQEHNSLIEEQRQIVLDEIYEMEDLDGNTFDDNAKNNVLDKILEIDESGDSIFLSQVLSNPKELIRAAYWYENGPDITRQLEEQWKREKSAAYKRGREDALKGSSNGRTTFINKSDKTTKPTDNNYLGMDDLHD